MKRVLLGIIAIGALAGCASQNKMEHPKGDTQGKNAPSIAVATENKSPQQNNTQTKPAPSPGLSSNPLKDPNNILSKRNIFFDYDSFSIKDEFKLLIEAHAKYLTSHSDARMSLQGNTDERGSREYNIALGNRRAESVKKMMVVLGASNGQIETISFGKEKPKATCHEESCWKENRRDDIVYQGE